MNKMWIIIWKKANKRIEVGPIFVSYGAAKKYAEPIGTDYVIIERRVMQ